MIVDDDPYTRSLLPHLGNLCSVKLACYSPVTLFVVPDVLLLDALGNQLILTLMPNSLPSVEQVA
jgi:hypothetical protein